MTLWMGYVWPGKKIPLNHVPTNGSTNFPSIVGDLSVSAEIDADVRWAVRTRSTNQGVALTEADEDQQRSSLLRPSDSR